MSGYIKIHRSIQEKGWYRKPGYAFLWIHILMKANYSANEFWFNGQLIKLKPGQFVTGRNQMALETALSGSFIERALKVFESEQQIEQQTNNRNRLITILNYDLYQQSEQPKKNIRTTSGQQADTNKELKENKEVIYSLYPSKCPVRNSSNGKSSKDKDKIELLLKTNSPEKLTAIIKRYTNECIRDQVYMKNFSTFLNNLPDYGTTDTEIKQEFNYMALDTSLRTMIQIPETVQSLLRKGATMEGLKKRLEELKQ